MDDEGADRTGHGHRHERYHVIEDRAFAFPTRLSQNRNVRLRDLALEFIAGASEGGDHDTTSR